MAYKRKLNTSVPRQLGRPRQFEGPEYEKMDRLLEPMEFSRDSPFDEVWIRLVNALIDSGPYTSGQKLYAVRKVIPHIKTDETLRFFPIAEFFEGDPKDMVQILKKISRKKEITEFRFLKEDKLEVLELYWNCCLNYEESQTDLENFRVELKKMINLHTIKIDLFPISLENLMDLCENLQSLTTLEVIIKYDIDLNSDRSKDVRTPMKRLTTFKYNVFVEKNFHDISSFEKVLDEFFMYSLPNAKVIGQPGRFVDITSLFEDLNRESRLTHVAHKLRGDVRKPLHTIFGDVDQLQIEWCEDFGSDFNFDAFLKFPKLEQLTLTNVPKRKYVEKFTDAYELKLKDVTVKFSTAMKLDMNPFHDLYTTLRKLVVGVIKPVVGTDSIWSFKYFMGLTQLEIEFAINWDVKWTVCVVPIYDLLSAPNLEKVKLFGDLAVDAEHLKKVHDEIISGKILTKVGRDFELRLIMPGTAKNVISSKEIDSKRKSLRKIREFFKKKIRL